MNAEPKISRRPRCGEWLFPPHLATVTASSLSGHVFIPQTPEAFTYDDDGNLTSDGRWTYTWDAENRLVQMTGHTTIPTGARKRMVFEYDGQSRRIHKQVYEWDSTDYSTTASLDQRFVYDGWNLLAEVGTSGSLVRSYVWGLDLSGSLQGAGGVGGLLLVTCHASPVTSHFAAYDGNGNVAALVKTSDGTTTANYEYGPFGELIRATGPMAKVNPLRFSTKYQDEESDLLYYGYRFYNQSTGRWLSRDPLGERGGLNLYRFVRNNPIQNFDAYGMDENVPQTPTPEQQADQDEWNKLGCGDCPAKAVQDRQYQANQNIIDLIDWATGKCHSLKDWADLTKGKTLSTAGKGGYRSPELKKMPACIRKAVEWIEESKILTTTSVINTLNLAFNPLSETPWCCLGNAFAADEANRQKWLYQRLSVVQKRCDELKKKLPPSVTNPTE